MSDTFRSLETIESHIISLLLPPEANRQYQEGAVAKLALKRYLSHILRISQAYVDHAPPNTLFSPISNIETATAYALYYLSLNACKILHLLNQLPGHFTPSHVLDIGCGPGTVGLAIREHLKGAPFELACVENSASMREIASRLLQAHGSVGPNKFALHPNLDSMPKQEFDLIVAANVLAEMSEETAKSTLSKCVEWLDKHGFLVLLEPGQQAHTRRLMKLRDWLLANYRGLAPIFPCFRADSCPMLQMSESDWCHGTLEWKQPPLHRQLDGLLGFNKHRIKYSALILQKGGAVASGTRVIAATKKTRYGYEGLLCGETFYGIARLAKKRRSPSTRIFEKARVFDRLELPEPLASDLEKDGDNN